jgi:hypothetical protein
MKHLNKRVRGGAAATMTVLLAAAALATMAPSQALDSAGVGPRDSSRAGFPAFYTDDNGVALQLCVDGSARCGAATLRSDGAGGAGVAVAPDGEGFYWMATTSLAGPNMNLDIEFAAEAAWLDRRTPITFDRVRIRGHADAPGDITVNTPYGPFTVTADDPANARNVNFTEDVGCAIGPCNFRAMTTLAEAHITDWITSTTPPAGYLGDSVTSEPATIGAGGPAATISVAGQDSTSDWVVMGKIAPANRLSLPTALTFRKAATKKVTMKNLGTASRTITTARLTGDRTFTKLATSTCTNGLVLAPGDSCTVAVRYRPKATRSTGTLTITDNVKANTVRVRGR